MRNEMRQRDLFARHKFLNGVLYSLLTVSTETAVIVAAVCRVNNKNSAGDMRKR
ncbi:hypothetical protein KCP76_02095 [Salmonella enterica subsp. enterica serovar Weltevreden]|nr:hypothetical protein KCP76_02095 [Salmonella enterica subsp. enterica serovar Weltevreden]